MNIRSKLRAARVVCRPLDLLVVVLAVGVVVYSFRIWQQPARAQRVQIYQEGILYQEVDLSAQQIIPVQGPLGITRIEIQHGKARISADPSPRQYCVKAGWLDKAGQTAMCLPNHTGIVIIGKNQERGYDSLSY